MNSQDLIREIGTMLPTSTVLLLVIPPIVLMAITAAYCLKYWNRLS